jgi:hypothetical protein
LIHIDVRADIRQAQIFLRELAGEKGTARATSRALNRTATTVRADAARLMQKKRALRIGVIKQSLSIHRATVFNLEARVTTSGKAIPIRHFSNVGKRGVTARVEPGTKRVLLRRHGNKAFTTPYLGGGVTVFVRRGRSRLPIAKWSPVPGLPTVFVQSHITRALKAVVASVFPRRFKEEMNYEINKAKARAGA